MSIKWSFHTTTYAYSLSLLVFMGAGYMRS